MTLTQEFKMLTKRAVYRGSRKARRAEKRLDQMIYGGGFAWMLGRAFGMSFGPVHAQLARFAPQLADGTKEGA